MTDLKISVKRKLVYKMGSPIYIDVRIKNQSRNDYYLSLSNTPFDTIPNNCFEVIKGGKRISYDGIMAKRVSDGISDLVLLTAGETRSARVCLSDMYAMYEVGKYTVQIKAGNIGRQTRSVMGEARDIKELENFPELKFSFYLMGARKPTRTKGDRHRAWDIFYSATTEEFPEPRIVFPKGNDKEEAKFRNMVLDAHYEMIHYLKSCVKEFQAVPREQEEDNFHYELVFGAYDVGRYHGVKEVYEHILEKLKAEKVTYERNQNPECERDGTFAYTYFNSRTVYLCKEFGKVGISGEDSRIGTLLHEWTHAMEDIDDVDNCYGRDKCIRLATKSPEKAVNNADNYEFLLESQFLNWKREESWLSTQDAATLECGGPTSVLYNNKIYLFYCNQSKVLKVAQYDGDTFCVSSPMVYKNEAGIEVEFTSDFHPEAIAYGNTIYVFYIPSGKSELHYTMLLPDEQWMEGMAIRDVTGKTIEAAYPAQPIIKKSNKKEVGKIELFYKKNGEERFFTTAFNPAKEEWEEESQVPGETCLAIEERFNPAVFLLKGTLYMVYCHMDTKELRYAYYDAEHENWKMDKLICQESDLDLAVPYEVRAVVMPDEKSVYLMFRFTSGTSGQIQVNYLYERKKLMWVDGERLGRNTFADSIPQKTTLCSVVPYQNYHYMFSLDKKGNGIYISKQMKG